MEIYSLLRTINKDVQGDKPPALGHRGFAAKTRLPICHAEFSSASIFVLIHCITINTDPESSSG